jgi:hypothetical protein
LQNVPVVAVTFEIVECRFTVAVSVALLAAKLAAVYAADTVSHPSASAVVLKAACPEPFTAVGPATTVPFTLNVTLPEVTGLPKLFTVAVNVTLSPTNDVLAAAEEARVVDVAGRAAVVIVMAQLEKDDVEAVK